MVERNQDEGLGLCKGPVLGPSSMRLQSWLPRATLWGWNETKQRPFCGAGFLRIAMAGLHEAPPQPAMSPVLCSEVFLCLVSWHRLRDVEEVELWNPPQTLLPVFSQLYCNRRQRRGRVGTELAHTC